MPNNFSYVSKSSSMFLNQASMFLSSYLNPTPLFLTLTLPYIFIPGVFYLNWLLNLELVVFIPYLLTCFSFSTIWIEIKSYVSQSLEISWSKWLEMQHKQWMYNTVDSQSSKALFVLGSRLNVPLIFPAFGSEYLTT